MFRRGLRPDAGSNPLASREQFRDQQLALIAVGRRDQDHDASACSAVGIVDDVVGQGAEALHLEEAFDVHGVGPQSAIIEAH